MLYEHVDVDLPDLSRADVALIALPLVFLGTYGAGRAVFETPAVAVSVASVACFVLIADVLFWHAPDDR